MSVFAGIYSFDGDVIIDEKNKNLILDTFTRDNVDVESYTGQGFFLAKADVGAYQEPSFLSESSHVAALAGDPILRPPSNIGRNRRSVLEELSSVFLAGGKSILRDCQGVYNLSWYNLGTRDLLLVADKLGVRPLYYYMDDHYLYFSGNLGVLEALNSVVKRMDIVGVTEKLIIGSFLDHRTPYADIHVLRGGEYLEIHESKTTISHYFKWDDIKISKSSTNDLLDQAYELFTQTITSRAWRDDAAVGFLSGGMDSRAVITSLWEMEKKLFCANLSFPGSQDYVYPQEYADLLGLNYYSFKRFVNEKFNRNIFQNMMCKFILQIVDKEISPPRLPRLVWSGDGGSVGLGHVYMNKNIVEKMRKGHIDEVLLSFMKNKLIPKRLVDPGIKSQIDSLIHEDLLNELKTLKSDDPGRAFYAFLLNNDQRCHMYDLYEDILDHRLELLLPFYDGCFLELIMSIPVDVCLYHDFYTQLFDKFPKEIKSVPWQTYPGHLRCPVTDNRDISYQWSPNEGNKKFYSKTFYDACKRDVFDSNFPNKIMNKTYLLMSMLLHSFNIKDYSSEYKFASTYHKYVSICDGDIVI